MFSKMQKKKAALIKEKNIGDCIFKGREWMKLTVFQIKVLIPPASVSSSKWAKTQIRGLLIRISREGVRNLHSKHKSHMIVVYMKFESLLHFYSF